MSQFKSFVATSTAAAVFSLSFGCGDVGGPGAPDGGSQNAKSLSSSRPAATLLNVDDSTADGRELFREVMLGEPESAAQHAEQLLGRQNAQQPDKSSATRNLLKARVRLFEQRVLAAVQEEHPGFFAEFSDAMRSGDHYIVDRAVQRASGILKSTVLSMPEVKRASETLKKDPSFGVQSRRSLSAISRGEMPEGMTESDLDSLVAEAAARGPMLADNSDVFILVVVVANLVLAVNVAINWNITISSNITHTKNYTTGSQQLLQSDPQTRDLSRDHYIDQLVDTYAGDAFAGPASLR